MGEETAKQGWTPSSLRSSFDVIDARFGEILDIRGLMTMAPLGADEATLRSVFGGLASLRNRLEMIAGVNLPELSMGMSDDFEIAVEEGATLVRLGTILLGPMPPRAQ